MAYLFRRVRLHVTAFADDVKFLADVITLIEAEVQSDINIVALETVENYTPLCLDKCGLHDLAYNDRLRTLSAQLLKNKIFHADMPTAYKCLHHVFNYTADDLGLSFMDSNKTHGGFTHPVQNVIRPTYSSFLRYRVPPAWKKVKINVTRAPTLSSFKINCLKPYYNYSPLHFNYAGVYFM